MNFCHRHPFKKLHIIGFLQKTFSSRTGQLWLGPVEFRRRGQVTTTNIIILIIIAKNILFYQTAGPKPPEKELCRLRTKTEIYQIVKSGFSFCLIIFLIFTLIKFAFWIKFSLNSNRRILMLSESSKRTSKYWSWLEEVEVPSNFANRSHICSVRHLNFFQRLTFQKSWHTKTFYLL